MKDSTDNLLEIPVLVRNYRNNAGNNPNTDFDPVDTWVLVRRFFMIDTLSGFVEGQSSPSPKYIRWASEVRLKIMMDPGVRDQIYRPLLIVSYVEVEASAMSPGAKFTVNFAVEYFSDYSGVLRWAGIGFALFNVLVILVVAARFHSFTKRNPRSTIGANVNKAWLSRFILYLFDYWSNFMFFLIFLISMIIFVSYKLGMQATMLLPEEGEASAKVNQPFYAVFGICVFFKTIAILMKIYDQANMDIFIIDLEQPNKLTKQVVAWRHYFVANEFAEL